MCPWARHLTQPFTHSLLLLPNTKPSQVLYVIPSSNLFFLLSHTLLALLTHQMSVHAPVPLGNALNPPTPPLTTNIPKPLTCPAIPVPLLIPLASPGVNAMQIPGITFGQRYLTSSKCQLCPLCIVTPLGINITKC